MAKKKVFNFGKNPVMVALSQGSNTLNIYVFGEIGCWWGLNKNEVLMYLKGKKYNQINLVISSNGGDLAEALVIRDLLKAYPANVTTYLTGFCASAATILADAGDSVVMSRQCIYMIHKPLFEWTGGNADDLRNDAEILDTWENIAVEIYMAKTGLGETEIRSLMQDESFLGADEALALGFVDEVVDVLEIDFELDTTGLQQENEQENTFIREPIDFKSSATIYNQAVAAALKGGYRQISPAMMQGFHKKEEKTFEMNQLSKMFVSMLVKAGFITTENEAAAMEAANKIETPEMIATIVKEEVAKQVKNVAPQAPSMKVTDIVKTIEAATDEEKAEIAKVLNIQPFDDTDIKTKMQDLSSKVATLVVGEGGGKDGNGEDDLGGNPKKATPTFKEREHAKMYLQAFEDNHIDAATYKALTGQNAPKRTSQN